MKSIMFPLATLIWVACSGASSADVIFSNLGPDDSFNESFGYIVGQTNFGLVFDTAQDFDVLIGGFGLDSVDVAISYSRGQNLVNLSLYNSDENGRPGQMLEQTSSTGFPIFDMRDNKVVTRFQFSGRTNLDEGSKYFIVASAEVDGESSLVWHAASNNNDLHHFRSSSDPNWRVNTGAPAMRVNGIVAVPEPNSLSVVCAIMISLLLARRRR